MPATASRSSSARWPGRLLIESEIGKGSAFTIVLPIKRSAAPAAVSEADASLELPPLAEAV